MNRLTPIRCGREIINCKESYTQDKIQQIFLKLGQKEDDDEELGIDSHILFQALRNGFVYFMNEKTYEQCEIKYFSPLKEFVVLNKRTSHFCKLNEYGSSWALTREELEK